MRPRPLLSILGVLALLLGLLLLLDLRSPDGRGVVLEETGDPRPVAVAPPASTVGERRDVLPDGNATEDVRPEGSTWLLPVDVVDPDGTPVAGAVVTLFQRDARDDFVPAAAATTDAAGRAVLRTAEPWSDGRVLRAVELGDEQVELVVPTFAEVDLRVLDQATGLPLPGYVLRWSWDDPSAGVPLEHESSIDVDRALDRGIDRGIDLPVGVVALEVDASDIGYAPLAIERFEVPAGEAGPPREIRVRRAD